MRWHLYKNTIFQRPTSLAGNFLYFLLKKGTDMKREEAIKKLREIVEDVKTCMFTTTDAECNVFSRPMLTIKIDNELNLWFFSNEDAEKITELANQRQATLVYAHPGKNTYMTIYGSCDVITNDEKMNELWTPALRSWFPNGLEDPQLCLVQVRIDEAAYWNNSQNEMIPLLEAGSHNAYQTAVESEPFIPQVSNW